MAKRFVSHLLFSLMSLPLFADITGIVVDEEGEPLPGANVYWIHTTLGTTTDTQGHFTLKENSDKQSIVVTFVGYDNDTVSVAPNQKNIRIQKKNTEELAEVSVSAEQTVTVFNPRVNVIQTQQMNDGELRRAACCNLGESFVNNPSVDVSYSDAATGAKQIRLLGLSGSYVQMLTEKIPNFRGLASPYGLGYIPGPWMESIQVSKGSSSVIDGFEALTGQINVEYKKPFNSPRLSVNLFGSSARRLEGNVDGAITINDKLSTLLFGHYENDTKEHDMNKDGFLDQPKVQQINLFNRWYYRNEHLISQWGAKYIYEDRRSGQTEVTKRESNDPFEISIITQRGELFTKNGILFDDAHNSSLGIIVAGSYHHQDAEYGLTQFEAEQGNLYSNVIYETTFSPIHSFKAGASFIGDWYNQKWNELEETQNEFIPGLFAEYTFNWKKKFVAMIGLRGDYHSDEGFFVTPRLHLKYDPWKHLYFRASVGKGYRTMHVLGENNYLMASSRTIDTADDLKRDESWNYGVSATGYIPTGKNRQITVIAEWYYTQFQNQVVMDMDSDPHKVSFYNLDGRSYANNFQVEVSYEFFRGFNVTAAHRITDVKQTIGGELRRKPLTGRFKTLLTIMYQTPLKKWQFDVTGQLNGGGRLPDPDASNALWKETYGNYPILNAQVTKRFKTWSIYLGAENILDFTQKEPIIDAANPFGNNFDASMVWGPMHGRKFYIGGRWNLNKKE